VPAIIITYFPEELKNRDVEYWKMAG